MKQLSLIAIILGGISLLLGVITQLVGQKIIVTANAYNSLAQTLILFSIALVVYDYFKCKE